MQRFSRWMFVAVFLGLAVPAMASPSVEGRPSGEFDGYYGFDGKYHCPPQPANDNWRCVVSNVGGSWRSRSTPAMYTPTDHHPAFRWPWSK
ncbi:MAG TPA: hypothetical protein VHV77_06145 [Pirellulales bacterium]|jgi:hypothetical protein|nr:hypothetical protein [Pirellulales bacterium]